MLEKYLWLMYAVVMICVLLTLWMVCFLTVHIVHCKNKLLSFNDPLTYSSVSLCVTLVFLVKASCPGKAIYSI